MDGMEIWVNLKNTRIHKKDLRKGGKRESRRNNAVCEQGLKKGGWGGERKQG